MSGRNRIHRHPNDHYDSHSFPRHTEDHHDSRPLSRHRALPVHPTVLEDELELQHRDIERLHSENRRLVDDNVMLQSDLTGVKDEIQRLRNAVLPKLQGEREAQRRDLVDRRMKLEAEIRSAEPLRDDVAQLKGEAQKLSSQKQELTSQVKGLTKDVGRLQTENKQVESMKTDVDKIRKELVDVRRAFEYEKKGNEELLEQNRTMEENLISMAREIEQLRAEQASADRMPVLGLGTYGLLNGRPEIRYPGPYADLYGAGLYGSYEKRQRR